MALYQLEAKLGGELLDSIAKEALTASVRVRFFDKDQTNQQRTPDANTLLFEIDPENTQGKLSEYIVCDSHSTTNGVTTLVNVQRGLSRDATIPPVSNVDRAQSWDAGSPIGSATQPYNDNTAFQYFNGTTPIPGPVTIGGDLTVQGNTSLQDLIVDDTLEFIDNTVTIRRDGAGDMLLKDNSTAEVSLATLAAAAGVDTQVRVTNNDTTSGFLDDKLTVGDGISKTVNNPAANENLEIAVRLASGGGLGFNAGEIEITDLVVPTSTEAAAVNSSLFQNSDDPNNLGFKDSTGTVHRQIDQANLDSQINVEVGDDTWNPAAVSETFVVSHNLGRVPRLIKVDASGTIGATSNANQITWSIGKYDGTNTTCLSRRGNGVNTEIQRVTGSIISIDNGTVGDGWRANVSAATTTDFTLQVTSFDGALNSQFTWEVQ